MQIFWKSRARQKVGREMVDFRSRESSGVYFATLALSYLRESAASDRIRGCNWSTFAPAKVRVLHRPLRCFISATQRLPTEVGTPTLGLSVELRGVSECGLLIKFVFDP